MKRTEISTVVANLQREIAVLENPTLTRLVSGVLSLFEDVVKEHRIPVNVLDPLTQLHGQKYSTKAEFIKAVEAVIGGGLSTQYGALLLPYARYKKRHRKPNLPEIQIDREKICGVDVACLPEDAEFKGYDEKIVQDLLLKTDNVRFRREVYYSPALQKTYRGKVPQGYDGGYGPHIKAQIVSFTYVNNMSIAGRMLAF